MGKTFYEVRYGYDGLGFACLRTRWFDDREAAYKFFRGFRFADKPRAHHFRCQKKIVDYQLRVEADC